MMIQWRDQWSVGIMAGVIYFGGSPAGPTPGPSSVVPPGTPGAFSVADAGTPGAHSNISGGTPGAFKS